MNKRRIISIVQWCICVLVVISCFLVWERTGVIQIWLIVCLVVSLILGIVEKEIRKK